MRSSAPAKKVGDLCFIKVLEDKRQNHLLEKWRQVDNMYLHRKFEDFREKYNCPANSFEQNYTK